MIQVKFNLNLHGTKIKNTEPIYLIGLMDNKWDSSNIYFPSGVSQNIGALEILDKIPNGSTDFILTVPYTGVAPIEPVLYVTYSGSPVLVSNYHYSTSSGTTNKILTIKNITLYTTVGYFFEFALKFSNDVTIDPEGITIQSD